MFWDGCGFSDGDRGQWFIDGCGNGLKAEYSGGLRDGCMIKSGYRCKFRQRTRGSF